MGDVDEVVQAGEDADLGELAHPGEKGELDVRVARLDGRVEPPQGIAVRTGQLRLGQRVQDRLVVLVHQHRHPLPGVLVQRLDQVGESFRPGGVGWCAEARASLHPVQLRRQVHVEMAGLGEAPSAEVEPHDGMAHRPVPAVVDVQSPEQRLVALEQLLQRVHEQALAETPRARQEVVGSPVHEPVGKGRLVHVVPAFLPDRAEGLDTDGQLAFRHGRTIAPASEAVKVGRGRCPKAPGSRRGASLEDALAGDGAAVNPFDLPTCAWRVPRPRPVVQSMSCRRPSRGRRRR